MRLTNWAPLLLAATALLLGLPQPTAADGSGNLSACTTVWQPSTGIDPSDGPMDDVWMADGSVSITHVWCSTYPLRSTVTIEPKFGGNDLLATPLVCNGVGVWGVMRNPSETIMDFGDTVDVGWTAVRGTRERDKPTS